MAVIRELLSVIILDEGVARTPAALQSTPATPLLATLERRSAADELVFTLSDLVHRLLLLSITLTPTSYAELRDAQALRVDYAGFPRELGELLKTPATDNNYVLVLCVGEQRHKFEVVQLSQFRLLPHIELELKRASAEELLRAVSKRATEMDAVAKAAIRSDNETKAILADKEQTLEDTESACAELESLRPLADACNSARGELEVAKRDAIEARREAEEARIRADSAERGRAVAEKERDDAAANTDGEARRRVKELANEVRKANSTIERLRDELMGVREHERHSRSIIERQESKVAELEKKAKEGEMRRGEVQSLKRQLKATEKQLDKNAEALASDTEIVTFLRRELERKEGPDNTPTPEQLLQLFKKSGGGGSGGGTGKKGAASAIPVTKV